MTICVPQSQCHKCITWSLVKWILTWSHKSYKVIFHLTWRKKNKSVTVVASSMVESCPIQTCCCRLTFHRTRTWSLKMWHGKQHELVLIVLTSTQLVFTPQYEQCQPEYSNYLLTLLLLHTSWPWLLLGTLTSLLPGKPAGYDYVAWRLWQQGLRRHLEQREFGPTGLADLWANSGESDAQSK